MKLPRLVFACALVAALAAGARAQEGDPTPPPRDPEGDAAAPDAIQQFDANGDGQLLGEELGRARAFMQALRRAVAERRGDRGPGATADGPRGPRERGRSPGPEAEGPRRSRERADDGDRGPEDSAEGRRGPRDRRPPRAGDEPEEPRAPERPAPPRLGEPMRLFEEFDANGNGELNRDEFRALMGAMRERGGPGGPPEGPRDGDRGPRFGDGDRGPEGRGDGRRGGPRDAGPPRRDGDAPQFDGPGRAPEADGDDSPGPPPRGVRPRDRDRRRPSREVGTDVDESGDREAANWPQDLLLEVGTYDEA